MHRSATNLLELGAWIQIGSCVFAAIIGASFVVASLINPESARAAEPLSFIATSLPVFLVLSSLLLSFVMKLRVERQKKVPFQDIKALSARLGEIGKQVKTRMGVMAKVEFVVSLRSGLVYTMKKRGNNRIMAGDRFLNGASDEELEGVLAHEIAHVSHMTKPRIMPILATVLIVVQVLFIPIPRIFIVLGAVFAMLLLLTIPGNWKTEYYADRVAAENVEAEKVIMGLKRLAKTSLSGFSFTHPPLARRIEKLERFSRSLPK